MLNVFVVWFGGRQLIDVATYKVFKKLVKETTLILKSEILYRRCLLLKLHSTMQSKYTTKVSMSSLNILSSEVKKTNTVFYNINVPELRVNWNAFYLNWIETFYRQANFPAKHKLKITKLHHTYIIFLNKRTLCSRQKKTKLQIANFNACASFSQTHLFNQLIHIVMAILKRLIVKRIDSKTKFFKKNIMFYFSE